MRALPIMLMLACTSADPNAGANGQNGAAGASGAQGPSGASGPSGPAGANAESGGTRLKARLYVAADGYRSSLGIANDASRGGEFCAFVKAADGVLRCLPNGGSCTPYFRDAACTVPACNMGCTNTVIREASPNICTTCPCTGGEARIYQPGAVIPDNLQLFNQYGGPTGCSSPPGATWNTGVTGTWREKGAEIPASAFMQGELIEE